jgi:hypothetical protein
MAPRKKIPVSKEIPTPGGDISISPPDNIKSESPESEIAIKANEKFDNEYFKSLKNLEGRVLNDSTYEEGFGGRKFDPEDLLDYAEKEYTDKDIVELKKKIQMFYSDKQFGIILRKTTLVELKKENLF